MLEQLEDLSFQCGMNQRYYQIQAADAWSWNTTIAIIVAIVVLISTIMSVAAYYRTSTSKRATRTAVTGWRRWALGFRNWWTYAKSALLTSIVSLFAATILNIAPTTSDGQYYSDMYRRWSDLRQDVDALKSEEETSTGGVPNEYVARRYGELLARKNSIQALETEPDMTIVEKCWEDENESRTGFRTTDPEEKPRFKGDSRVSLVERVSPAWLFERPNWLAVLLLLACSTIGSIWAASYLLRRTNRPNVPAADAATKSRPTQSSDSTQNPK